MPVVPNRPPPPPGEAGGAGGRCRGPVIATRPGYRSKSPAPASRPNLPLVDQPLHVTPGLVIPPGELHWRFDTAGGPGGQHANRSATRAELTFDLAASPAVPEDLRRRLLERLGARAPGGVIRLVVDDSRSQWRNRQTARRRLAALLEEGLQVTRPRRPTRPTTASRLRRLADKRHRAQALRRRRRPEPDED